MRTTEEDVRRAVETDLTSEQVLGFIGDASMWVDRNLKGRCSQMTPADLEIVEKYLAAAFITRREPVLRSAARGDIQEQYATDGQGLEFFKLAAGFDPCGIVSKAFLSGKRARYRIVKGFTS